MTEQQPMKMAAAEALYETTQPASFSLFTDRHARRQRGDVRRCGSPALLSFLATGDPNGEVEGINDLQRAYESATAPATTARHPGHLLVFRLMIGLGPGVAVLLGALGLWLTRRGRTPTSRWFWRAAVWSVALPLLANSFGWIFTEMGRQPWTVFGVLRTAASVSPTVGSRRGRHLADRASPCSTASWPWSSSAC